MSIETVTSLTRRVKRAEKYQSLNQVIKRDSLSACNQIPINNVIARRAAPWQSQATIKHKIATLTSFARNDRKQKGD